AANVARPRRASATRATGPTPWRPAPTCANLRERDFAAPATCANIVFPTSVAVSRPLTAPSILEEIHMSDIVIAGAVRDAIGKFGGTLAKTSAPELGATVNEAVLARNRLYPQQMSEVMLGQVLAAGSGQNPARQSSIKSGLPAAVPAMTINKVCGSGLKAVMLAAQAVHCGDADIVIAGGQENMSAAPHVLLGSRDGVRMGDAKRGDSMIGDGLWDVYNQYHMGITAENVAKEYGISRQTQDAFAVASQNKAEAAQKAGRFKDEIVPVMIPQRKGEPVAFADDEFIKAGSTVE